METQNKPDTQEGPKDLNLAQRVAECRVALKSGLGEPPVGCRWTYYYHPGSGEHDLFARGYLPGEE